MFKDIIYSRLAPRPTLTELEEYHEFKSFLEKKMEMEEEKNTRYEEIEKPRRQCREFNFYKNFIVETYNDINNNEFFRLLRTDESLEGAKDLGIQFYRLGDVYNYVDDNN